MKKLILSVLLIMGPVLIFGYLGKPVEMGIVLFAGFACSVIINIEKFNSFRAGELEATIRHAEEVISDANATIEQLKSATEPMMNYLLAHVARGDRAIGLNTSDKELLYLKMKENIVMFDLQNEYTSELLEEVEEKIIQTSLLEVSVAAQKAGGTYSGAKAIRELVFPEDTIERKQIPITLLREVLEENPNLLNEEVEGRLVEYERILNEYSKTEET